jgi:thiazole synthase
MDTMVAAVKASGTEMVTVAIRRINLDDKSQKNIIDYLDLSSIQLLPNTAGCYTMDDALRVARLSRAAGFGTFIKLEVIGDEKTLLPDVPATIEATKILVKEGFTVLPYTNDDPIAAKRLVEAGAATVMPLASPIGSGQGFIDFSGIKLILEDVDIPVVVDAGLGVPSDAAQAMELGADAVLVNTGIARAGDPVRMAEGFRLAVTAGRLGYLAGRIPKLPYASASSPTAGVVGR